MKKMNFPKIFRSALSLLAAVSLLVGMVPAEQICKVAVGFACQLVENGRIARETHDVQVDYIVTESQVVELG